MYLALLLTGDGSTELGDGRSVASVAFQQAPEFPIDDLVVHAQRPDERSPSLVLAIGVRRAPRIITSDPDTQSLMVEYVRALLSLPDDGLDHRFALVVAGQQDHAREVAELAALAAQQMKADSFYALIGTEGKIRKALADRLVHVQALVAGALKKLGVEDADESQAQARTWELLSRLDVLMPRIEEPDRADWGAVLNRLVPLARGNDLIGAGHLLDRLENLAGQYVPSAAEVDLTILRRDVGALLEPGVRRDEQGWSLLRHLETQALSAVRDKLGLGDGERTLRIDRSVDGRALIAHAKAAECLLVTGESGVGKSALVLGASSAAAVEEAEELEVLCLNLRYLPTNSLDLVTSLGGELSALLSEMGAAHRLLVIDGADAALETGRAMFVYLLQAARASGVKVVAVAAAESKRVVQDLLEEHLGAVTEEPVAGLSDEQLAKIASAFPELERVAWNARSREFLRRLVVVDLLVRSNLTADPLSDADAMREIWAGLVRRHGQHDRGLPDAREQALLRMASAELTATPAMQVVAELDPAALDGLRRDGLVRTPAGTPWRVVPEFAHEELRRYSVARVLLGNGDPAGDLLAADAPRWALSAATLACQTLLSTPASAESPLEGRFARLQAGFDTIGEAHGARWQDVPSEALLTLGEPGPVFADAWAQLRGGGAEGMLRLLRLVGQRHRRDGLVDAAAIEPIIVHLLDEDTPWRESEQIADGIREWLRALSFTQPEAGHPLRVRLRERLVSWCEQGRRRLEELKREQERAAEERARRKPTPEEIERERIVSENQALFREIGFGGRRRRREEVPRELTDDTVLELLALLGPDLGEEGERLLREVAEHTPSDLAPAVDEMFTGRALALYGRGLLVDLTEAYYLDEDEDGSGFHEDGVRRHGFLGLGVAMNAYYRGPFMALFESDFRRGIAMLNRLLNHAARARVRTLAGIGNPWGMPPEGAEAEYTVELSVTGGPREYVGDSHVWVWYRGTGVGPYPCMSALQALERVCDNAILAGVPVDRLVAILLDGCENLAMLGLVVGLLVRHLEVAGRAIDPFLAEPAVWELEFSRMVSESSGLAASSEGLVEPERRKWSLREASSMLVVKADTDRADELRALGEQLVAAAERVDAEEAAAAPRRAGPVEVDVAPVTYTTKVRNWASLLDRTRYHAYTKDGMTVVQAIPPEDVQEALAPGNQDLQRGNEALRLVNRYFWQRRARPPTAPEPSAEELAADLVTARGLVEDPPSASAAGEWDTAALVAAAALEAHLIRNVMVAEDGVEFSVETILRIGEAVMPADDLEFSGSMFEQGADRTSAGAIPLLLLPRAAELREHADAQADGEGSRCLAAARRLARGVADEARLRLSRGLDALWATPCAGDPCHHKLALELAIESMRDCAVGEWDNAAQRHRVRLISDPVEQRLAEVADDDLLVMRLDAAIRAIGAAVVTSGTCIHAEASALLPVLLEAQRRGLLAAEHNGDERGSHTLVAARVLLGLAAAGDAAPLHAHIEAYADNGTLLSTLLRALAATAEETEALGEAARRIWPGVIAQVLALHDAGHTPFSDTYSGESALAALVPAPTYDAAFLYREIESEPVRWADPLGWREAIESWLPLAGGKSQCVDTLIMLLRTLQTSDQATTGLTWVSSIVMADVDGVARRSYLLAEWLIELRTASENVGTLQTWQDIVDLLVVAGIARLAPYSE
ncbi:MAG: hypothetical protein ACLPUT_10040 [Solirubrobacteraceae bacterium]